MKDVYKHRINDTMMSVQQRIKIVQEMMSGQRPADPQIAAQYLKEVQKGLESIQEIVDLS
jgi:hypothetical protein